MHFLARGSPHTQPGVGLPRKLSELGPDAHVEIRTRVRGGADTVPAPLGGAATAHAHHPRTPSSEGVGGGGEEEEAEEEDSEQGSEVGCFSHWCM